jgi:hypothetical protein
MMDLMRVGLPPGGGRRMCRMACLWPAALRALPSTCALRRHDAMDGRAAPAPARARARVRARPMRLPPARPSPPYKIKTAYIRHIVLPSQPVSPPRFNSLADAPCCSPPRRPVQSCYMHGVRVRPKSSTQPLAQLYIIHSSSFISRFGTCASLPSTSRTSAEYAHRV